MTFSQALDLLVTKRARVARRGWNGKGMFLQYVPDVPAPPGSLYQLRGFIELKDATDCLVPWVASQSDLLAVDWVEVAL